MESKKFSMEDTICIDFDGVCQRMPNFVLGQKNVPFGEPLPGLRSVIGYLRTNCEKRVVIFTNRLRTKKDKIQIQKWFDENDIKIDDITNKKIAAQMYVDDRAIRFRGDWQKTLKDMKAFKPWWQKGKKKHFHNQDGLRFLKMLKR